MRTTISDAAALKASAPAKKSPNTRLRTITHTPFVGAKLRLIPLAAISACNGGSLVKEKLRESIEHAAKSQVVTYDTSVKLLILILHVEDRTSRNGKFQGPDCHVGSKASDFPKRHGFLK